MTKASACLISMPWAPVSEPSLGLSILQQDLLSSGISSKVCYFNIHLLRYLKLQTYKSLAEMYGVNDFLFSGDLEREVGNDQLAALYRACHRFRGYWPDYSDAASIAQKILEVREKAIPRYLAECAEAAVGLDADLYGFTCMFDQTFASLALARQIKARKPSSLIAFGGYALEGAVGRQLIEKFPFIDVVLYGDGEKRIRQLVDASRDRSLLPTVAGVDYRSEAGSVRIGSTERAELIALDESPPPRFEDFFEWIERFKKSDQVEIMARVLPIEASRGCWWGQKKHCIFCGIDKLGLSYRSKSPSRVISDMGQMVARYGAKHLRFSDYIFPHTFFRDLLPSLGQEPARVGLSAEMKANLTAEKFCLLKDAGFEEVQLGVESFSTPVLKLMDKGVTGIQNVCALVLGRQYGIVVRYNLLYGFPNEELEWYAELARNIPRLHHLDAPESSLEVLITRFAPLHSTPERFSATPVTEADSQYEVILSEAARQRIGFDLSDYAYYFKKTYSSAPELRPYFSVLDRQCQLWRKAKAQWNADLYCRNQSESIEFFDSRSQPLARRLQFGYNVKVVYNQLLGVVVPQHRLLSILAPRMEHSEVVDALRKLDRECLIYREGDMITGLAPMRNQSAASRISDNFVVSELV